MSNILFGLVIIELGVIVILSMKLHDNGWRMRAAWRYARAIKIRVPKGDKDIYELASELQATLDIDPGKL